MVGHNLSYVYHETLLEGDVLANSVKIKLVITFTFNVRDLKKILRDRHATDFYRCVTEKMLTYALGRGMEETDEQTLDLIVQRLTENDGRFSALIRGVIESAPFQKQRNITSVASSKTDAN